ncbi:MAG: helix-turn-helix domain-containing protein [Clostridiales Family XIII bacterium]|jgi:AraC-like DNA-binding protein|nr:helix-turn-helix domain-containing protein [Clostridiales Family XIII bacterium]
MLGHIEFEGSPILLELSVVTKLGLSFHRDALELVFVLEGEVEVAEVSEASESAKLQVGDFVIIDAGILHSISAEKPAKLISLFFDLSYYQKKIPHMRGISFMFRPDESNPETRKICGAMRNYLIRLFEVKMRGVTTWQAIYAEIGEIMLALLIKWLTNMNFLKVPLSSLNESDKERLYSIIAQVSRNYQRRDLLMKDIAASQNLSLSRILHFWKEIINIPPRDAILMNRINEAARLLQESDMPINEISEICGFSSEKYLYQHFKVHYKMTPNEFRRRIAGSRKEASRFELLDIRDEAETIAAYFQQCFMPIDDYSFLGLEGDHYISEKNIFNLYNFVFSLDEEKIGKLRRGSEYGYLSAENGNVLIKRNNKYQVNWEYMFSYIYWYFQMGFKIKFIISFQFMEANEWERLIIDMWREIVGKLGEQVHQMVEWSIKALNIDELYGAISLAERLSNRDGIGNVITLLQV